MIPERPNFKRVERVPHQWNTMSPNQMAIAMIGILSGMLLYGISRLVIGGFLQKMDVVFLGIAILGFYRASYPFRSLSHPHALRGLGAVALTVGGIHWLMELIKGLSYLDFSDPGFFIQRILQGGLTTVVLGLAALVIVPLLVNYLPKEKPTPLPVSGKAAWVGFNFLGWIGLLGLIVVDTNIGLFINIPSMVIALGLPFFLLLMVAPLKAYGSAIRSSRDVTPLDETTYRKHDLLLKGIGDAFLWAGIWGTFIGAVQMLALLDDIRHFGPATAVLLLAPLYTLCITQLIIEPLRNRLQARAGVERAKDRTVLWALGWTLLSVLLFFLILVASFGLKAAEGGA